MGVLRKAYPVSLKAVNDERGQVEALVSVFGNVDKVGDRVVPGAFAKSIEKWRESAYPVPVVFSHDWGDLWSHIGAVDSLEETSKGLKAVYTLDIKDNPAAAQAFRLIKRGTIRQHSFAYETVREQYAKDGANELLELNIVEVGPTFKGVNAETDVLAVKSALEKADEEHGKARVRKTLEDLSAASAAKRKAEQEAEESELREAGVIDISPDPPIGKIGSTGNSTGPSLHFEAKAGRVLTKADEAKLRAAMESISQILSSLDEETEKAAEPEAADKSVDTDEVDGKASDELLTLIAQIETLKG